MANQLEILISSERVADIVLELSQLDGVNIQLATFDAEQPDPTKKHPDYSLPDLTGLVSIIIELAPTIISVSGLASGLISLANTILKFRQDTHQKDPVTKPPTNPQIIINQQVINIYNFSNADDLALFLQEKLTDNKG
ncbi:MAG TPA: hypothetical protein VGD69_17560 [Herpetosiphonaceae bacterium]